MLPVGFEPTSQARKARMIGHYTTGARVGNNAPDRASGFKAPGGADAGRGIQTRVPAVTERDYRSLNQPGKL